MRSTLYLKFALIYLAFGFVVIFTGATLTNELVDRYFKEAEGSSLSRQANIVGSEYLPQYFSEQITISDVRTQLRIMGKYLDASIWFVDNNGEMIAYTKTDSAISPPSIIDDFNPAESGSEQYITGNYHNYLNKTCITAISPVTQGFFTAGYVLIHKPLSSVALKTSHIMDLLYLTLAIFYFLSFSILLAFHFLIYVPLRRITEAATQYASGNLEYEIPVYSHDEMGYLSASLNFMSSQLRDMDDYQKKFIGNVSHDFRSPLTSIKGYIQALADGTIPLEMQEKYFRIILFETERLTDLTKDLLALNEFDTKELLLNKEYFDIHEMIKNVASSFEGVCTERKISFELLLASKVLYVYGDKSKIQQVLYNLFDNAIKFSNPNFNVSVETTELGEKVFISVKDYGMGIPKESIPKIWERFYKSDLSRGKDKKGTGLGLAIVKEVIHAHNENINVVSTEGVGTEFIFSLPHKKE